MQDMVHTLPQIVARILAECICRRESAIGDNTSCEWMDKTTNASWQMLPGHSGLREFSVVHYMEIDPANNPEMFQENGQWSLEFSNCAQAALSIVGPEAKSRLNSRCTLIPQHCRGSG